VESAAEVGGNCETDTPIIEQATQRTGQAVTRISNNWLVNNWLVRRVTGVLNLDWLVGATNHVDLESNKGGEKLQQEHPNESPSQIAHRIMVEKATYAGGIGLA